MDFSCLEMNLIERWCGADLAKNIYAGNVGGDARTENTVWDHTPNSVGLASVLLIADAIGTLERLSAAEDPGALVVLEVDDPLWVPAVAKVMFTVLSKLGRTGEAIRSGSFRSSYSSNRFTVLSEAGITDSYLPRRRHLSEPMEEAAVFEAISERTTVFIVVRNGGNHLSPSIRRAADHFFAVKQPTPDHVAKLIHVFGTDGAPTSPFPLPETIEPYRLAMAFRGNYSGQRILDLLSVTMTPAASGDDDPATKAEIAMVADLNLPGMKALELWGQDLKRDVEDISAGHAGLEDLSHGVLVSGPPGIGKTRSAELIASYCQLPLLYGSVSQWLGTGGGHLGTFLIGLRKTFAAAASSAPCLLVIDEIDALPARGKDDRFWDAAMSGVLEALDGVAGRPGVVIMGLCNQNPDKLDPALQRAGRFDQHIVLSTPDVEAIASMFAVCLPMLTDTDFVPLASQVLGCTFADVARMCKDARRLARRDKKPIGLSHVQDVVRKEIRPISGEQKLRIATHEAGHALAAHVCGVHITSISMSFSHFSKTSDGEFWADLTAFEGTMDDVRRWVIVVLGGRAAEIEVLGASAFGLSSDLHQATTLLRRALATEGLGDELVWYPANRNNPAFMPAHLLAALKAELKVAETKASQLMAENVSMLLQLRDALLERRTLSGEDIKAILAAPVLSKSVEQVP